MIPPTAGEMATSADPTAARIFAASAAEKVIAAQGELQASQTLAEAARTLATEPTSLQLRYLQTVTEIAAENNSTTIFPIPIEMFRPFLRAGQAAEQAEKAESEAPALSAGDLSNLMSQLRIEAARAPTKD